MNDKARPIIPQPPETAQVYKQMTKIFVFHDRDWEDRGTGAIYFILKSGNAYHCLNEYDLDRLIFQRNKDLARQKIFDQMDEKLRKENFDLTGLNDDTKHRVQNQKSGDDKDYVFDMETEVEKVREKLFKAYKGPKLENWDEEDDDIQGYLETLEEDGGYGIELGETEMDVNGDVEEGEVNLSGDIVQEKEIKVTEKQDLGLDKNKIVEENEVSRNDDDRKKNLENNDLTEAENTNLKEANNVDANLPKIENKDSKKKESKIDKTETNKNQKDETEIIKSNQTPKLDDQELTKNENLTTEKTIRKSDLIEQKNNSSERILLEEEILYTPSDQETTLFDKLKLPFKISTAHPKPLYGDLYLLVIKSENQQAPKRPDSDISKVLQGELNQDRSVLMWYDVANIHNIDPPYNNIIEWHNKDSKGMKMAISFLSQDRCLESYHFICKAAGIHTKQTLKVVHPGCDLKEILRELKSESSDIDSIKQFYTRGVSRHMRGIRNEYLYSLHYKRADRLACLGQIFKYFVFLSDMDLVLPLISDEHHVMFFTCLNYLTENQNKALDFRDFFMEQAGLVNILNIKSPEILNLINNRFRIIFMKDFVFSVSLNEELLQHYNIFLIMNGTTLLQHLIDKDCELFSDLDKLIHKKVGQMSNFFGEFFFTIKHHFMQFEQLKIKFSSGLVNRGVVRKLVGLVVTHLTRIRYLEKMLDYIELDGENLALKDKRKKDEAKSLSSGLKRVKRESLKHKIRNPYLSHSKWKRDERDEPHRAEKIKEENKNEKIINSTSDTKNLKFHKKEKPESTLEPQTPTHSSRPSEPERVLQFTRSQQSEIRSEQNHSTPAKKSLQTKRKNSYNQSKYEKALDRSKKVVLLSVEVLSFVIKHRKQSMEDIFTSQIEIKNPRMETNLISWLYDLVTFPSGSVREALFEIFKYFVHYIEEKDCVARFIKDRILPRALGNLEENEYKLDYYNSNGFQIFKARSKKQSPKIGKRGVTNQENLGNSGVKLGIKKGDEEANLLKQKSNEGVESDIGTSQQNTDEKKDLKKQQEKDIVRESISKIENRFREKLRKMRYTQYTEPEEERRFGFEDKADDSENSAKQSTVHKQLEGSVYSELQLSGEMLKKRVYEASGNGSEEDETATDIGLMKAEFKRQKKKIYLYVRFVMELVEVSDKLCASTGVESGSKKDLLLKLRHAFYQLDDKQIRVAFLRLLLELLKKGNKDEVEALFDREMILNLLNQAEKVFCRNSMISCLLKGIFSEIGRKSLSALRKKLMKVIEDENEARKEKDMENLKVCNKVQLLLEMGSRRESMSLGSGVDLGVELGVDIGNDDGFNSANKDDSVEMGLCMGYDDDEDEDVDESGLITGVDKINRGDSDSGVDVFSSGLVANDEINDHNDALDREEMREIRRGIDFERNLLKRGELTKEEEEQMDKELMEMLESSEQNEVEKESKRIRDLIKYRNVQRFGQTSFVLGDNNNNQKNQKNNDELQTNTDDSNKKDKIMINWRGMNTKNKQENQNLAESDLGNDNVRVNVLNPIPQKKESKVESEIGDIKIKNREQKNPGISVKSEKLKITLKNDGIKNSISGIRIIEEKQNNDEDELVIRERKKNKGKESGNPEKEKVTVQFLKLSHQ